jgi:hypothetical protein
MPEPVTFRLLFEAERPRSIAPCHTAGKASIGANFGKCSINHRPLELRPLN